MSDIHREGNKDRSPGRHNVAFEFIVVWEQTFFFLSEPFYSGLQFIGCGSLTLWRITQFTLRLIQLLTLAKPKLGFNQNLVYYELCPTD
jgi:hypothetical protein